MTCQRWKRLADLRTRREGLIGSEDERLMQAAQQRFGAVAVACLVVGKCQGGAGRGEHLSISYSTLPPWIHTPKKKPSY